MFLATQNGRPSKADGRPRLDNVRRPNAGRAALPGRGVETAVSRLGVCRRSVHRWAAAFTTHGIAGLIAESRRLHRLQVGVPVWMDIVVAAIRRSKPPLVGRVL
ncbi:MAG: helix-turn-helix domain-containing protein [Candidatus Dormibacteraeota bacterium]|uniref:Helix-turn-helix domain-containing protein n=1 Tax=Candidatus Dormiibacter inghamiae TaxID=3127013 RepID=A0A934KBM5_9BACT|nr:helix-turn-helix domain-containing protein [Candidatus Dormibacteraeota bacterium]MBJ7605067.1 helix-turn-helix domain-containing protein [Candidatus Dormibacteraeota bacterium]